MFEIDIYDLPDDPLLVKDEDNKYYLVSYSGNLIYDDDGIKVCYSHPGHPLPLEVTIFEPELNDVPATIKNWSPDLPNFVTPIRSFPSELVCKMSCIDLDGSGSVDVRDIDGEPVNVEPFLDGEEVYNGSI